MSDINEDDKTTVVLDINALKKELAERSVVEEETMEQELEFIVNTGTDHLIPNMHDYDEDEIPTLLDDDLSEELEKENVVLFDFQTEYFTKLVEKLPATFNYIILRELKELNHILSSKEPVTILFNYIAAPKAVNQLTSQIKVKFPHARTIIIAKGLTEEKVQQHQSTKAGANAYLNIPFSVQNFELTIRNVSDS